MNKDRSDSDDRDPRPTVEAPIGEARAVSAHARIAPPDQPGRLERLIADGVVTPPLDRKRAQLGKRITPTAPVSPLVIEDRR